MFPKSNLLSDCQNCIDISCSIILLILRIPIHRQHKSKCNFFKGPLITDGRTVVLLMDAKLCINLRNVFVFLNPRVIF